MISRRLFLSAAVPLWMLRAAGGKRVLVVVFQRGAADGLNIVVPHGESRYFELRPMLAVPKAEVLDLDGFFGFHPSLKPLLPLWTNKQLAVVHAAGSPDPTRSHFDAQDYMEHGTPGVKSTGDGWLNRALESSAGGSPLRAVAVTPLLPRTLAGKIPAISIPNLRTFQVRDPEVLERYGDLGRETAEAMRMVRSAAAVNSAVSYPQGQLGNGLRQIAALIKADAGMEVAFAETGGWDHHVNEAPQFKGKLEDFGGALAAFAEDLGSRLSNVTVVTMSEFGRTARENGNRGTDHGHANVMFVLNGPLEGGKVSGRWPGLSAEALYESRDLAMTTDFRAVLGRLVANPAAAFPGYRGGDNDLHAALAYGLDGGRSGMRAG